MESSLIKKYGKRKLLRFLTEIHPHLTPRQKKLNKGYLRKMKFGAALEREFMPRTHRHSTLVARSQVSEQTRYNSLNEGLAVFNTAAVDAMRRGRVLTQAQTRNLADQAFQEGRDRDRHFTEKQIRYKAFKFIFQEINQREVDEVDELPPPESPMPHVEPRPGGRDSWNPTLSAETRPEFLFDLNVDGNDNKHKHHKFLILRALCRVALYHYLDKLNLPDDGLPVALEMFKRSVVKNFFEPFAPDKVQYTRCPDPVRLEFMQFVDVRNKDAVQYIQTVSHSASAFKITNQDAEETAAKSAQPDVQYHWTQELGGQRVRIEEPAYKRRLSGIIIRNLLVLMDFFHDFYGDRGFGAKNLKGVDNIKLSINTFINYLFPAVNSFQQDVDMLQAGEVQAADRTIIYFRDLTDYDEPLYKADFGPLKLDAFPSILSNFITFYRKNTWKEENLGNNQWDNATKVMMSHLMTIMRTFNGDKVVDLLADKVKGGQHFMFTSDVSDHRFDLLFKNHQSIAFSPGSLLDANGSTMGTLRNLAPSPHHTANQEVYFYKHDTMDKDLQTRDGLHRGLGGVLFKELQDEYYIHPNLNPGEHPIDVPFAFSDRNFNSFFHSYTIFKLGTDSTQGREMYVPFKEPGKAMKCIFYVLRQTGEGSPPIPRCTCYFNVNTKVRLNPITDNERVNWHLIDTDSKGNHYYQNDNANMIIFCKGFSLPGVSDLTQVIAKATELYNPRLDIVPGHQYTVELPQEQAIKRRNTIVAILISLKFSMDASIAQTPEIHVDESGDPTNPILLTQGDKSSVFVSSIHNAVLTNENFGGYRPCNVLGPGSGEYNFSALNLTPRGGTAGFGKKQKRTHTRKNKFGTTAARTSIDADCGEVAALKVVEKTLGEKFLNTKIELKPILGDPGEILMAVSMEDLVQQIVDKGRGTQLQTREYLKLKINAEEARAKEVREEAARAQAEREEAAWRAAVAQAQRIAAEQRARARAERMARGRGRSRSSEAQDRRSRSSEAQDRRSRSRERQTQPTQDEIGMTSSRDAPTSPFATGVFLATGAPTPQSAQQRRRAGRPPGTFGNPKQRRGRWWYVDKKKTKTGYKLFRFLSPKYLGGTAVTPSYYEKITKKSFWKLSL